MASAGPKVVGLSTATLLTILAGCQDSPFRTQSTAPAPGPDRQQVMITTASGRQIPATSDGTYIVTFQGEDIPVNLAAIVTSEGGTLLKTLDGMGTAIVRSSDPGFATRLAKHPEVESVTLNLAYKRIDDPLAAMAPVGPSAAVTPGGGPSLSASLDRGLYSDCVGLFQDHPFDPTYHIPPQPNGTITDLMFAGPDDPSGPSGEPLSGYQWGLRVTRAAVAWCKGFTGRGVTVAVLDSGIDPDNPDLAPNLDLGRSRSFVASEPDIIDYYGHGSHVGGIIAAAQNHYGVTGIAPDATLLTVKVLDQFGIGHDTDVLQGMKYAVDAGARVLNMSLGGATADRGTRAAYRHALRYAASHRALVVAAAGNNAVDLDALPEHYVPAGDRVAIAVSATGPQGQQYFDNFAVYSNYGHLIDISAPGGNMGLTPDRQLRMLDRRDFVLSTFSTHAQPFMSGPFRFFASTHAFWIGTSMAAPHVSGALAVLIQAFPGDDPVGVKGRLLAAADDLGPLGYEGYDPYWGHGRLNIGRAVTTGN